MGLNAKQVQIIKSFWEFVTRKKATSPWMSYVVAARSLEANTQEAFENAIVKAKRVFATTIVIFKPETLGDTHDQCMANLQLLADANLNLRLLSQTEIDDLNGKPQFPVSSLN